MIEAETLEKTITTMIIIGQVGVEPLFKRIYSLGCKVAALSIHGGAESPCMKIVVEVPSGKLRPIIDELEKLTEENDALLITEG